MSSSGRCLPGSRLPPWLKVRLPRAGAPAFGQTADNLSGLRLHTVCQAARCPNIFECFGRKVATFLILGPTCTRACSFCNIRNERPHRLPPPDLDEPSRVAQAVAKLGLRHVVITSVTRDDLPDGGAGHFSATLRAVRLGHEGLSQPAGPAPTMEVLTPDFQGDLDALRVVLDAGPAVFNHNLETVAGLYHTVRPQADYRRSLAVLAAARNMAPAARIKSGLMVGLGESDSQVREAIDHLVQAGCHMITIGQYLRPSRSHPEPLRYVHPDMFDEYAEYGRGQGVTMFSAPLVRSSYEAEAFAS